MKTIGNSAVYTKQSKSGQLLELYYLIFWKSYPKEKKIYRNVYWPFSILESLSTCFIKTILTK